MAEEVKTAPTLSTPTKSSDGDVGVPTPEGVGEDTSIDESETQVYEVGYHLISSIDEKDLAGEVASIKSAVENTGGVFISDEFPKLTQLAYTVVKAIAGKNQKFNSTYFGWIKFEMKTSDIAKVKLAFDGNSNILRFLIIKTVRESTLAPKSVISPVSEVPVPKRIVKAIPIRRKEKKTEISEEELDKTIEELIVE